MDDATNCDDPTLLASDPFNYDSLTSTLAPSTALLTLNDLPPMPQVALYFDLHSLRTFQPRLPILITHFAPDFSQHQMLSPEKSFDDYLLFHEATDYQLY